MPHGGEGCEWGRWRPSSEWAEEDAVRTDPLHPPPPPPTPHRPTSMTHTPLEGGCSRPSACACPLTRRLSLPLLSLPSSLPLPAPPSPPSLVPPAMVCDHYIPHAFKPNVCRECGAKMALHGGVAAAPAPPPAASAVSSFKAAGTAAAPKAAAAAASPSPVTSPAVKATTAPPAALPVARGVAATTAAAAVSAAVSAGAAPAGSAAAATAAARASAGVRPSAPAEKLPCDSFERNAYVAVICKRCALPASAHHQQQQQPAAVGAASSAPSAAPSPLSSRSAQPNPVLSSARGGLASSILPSSAIHSPAPSLVAAAVSRAAVGSGPTASAALNGVRPTPPPPSPSLSASAATTSTHSSPSSSSSTTPVASSSAVVGVAGAGCAEFVAHSFFPLKCRECGQPKPVHSVQALTAAAAAKSSLPAATASPAVQKLHATASQPVRFTSPFSAPAPAAAAGASRPAVPSLSASAAPFVASASPSPAPSASSGIAARLASLGGGFSPLRVAQAPPARPAVVAALSEEESPLSSPPSGVRKPSLGVTRRQPSLTLPHFTPLSPEHSREPADAEPAGAQGEEQPLLVPNAEGGGAGAASSSSPQQQPPPSPAVGVVASPTAPSLSAASSAVSPAGAALPDEEAFAFSSTSRPADRQAAALIGSAKHANLWDNGEEGEQGSSRALQHRTPQPPPQTNTAAVLPPPPAVSSSLTPLDSSSSSLPSAAHPTGDGEQQSLSAYIAGEKAGAEPVIKAAPTPLFADWDDDYEGKTATADQHQHSQASTAAPAASSAASAMTAAPSSTALPPVAPSPLMAIPAAPTTVAPSTSASAIAVSSSASTAPLPLQPAPAKAAAAGVPARLPVTNPPVFFSRPNVAALPASSKPAAALSSASSSASSSSTPPPSSSPSSSTSSSTSSSSSSSVKPGGGGGGGSVFFKAHSLGFGSSVSDAVSVLPAQRARKEEEGRLDAADKRGGGDEAAHAAVQKEAEVGEPQPQPQQPPSAAKAHPQQRPLNLFGDDDDDDPFSHSTLFKQPPAVATAVVQPAGGVRKLPSAVNARVFDDDDWES